jgi:integrase
MQMIGRKRVDRRMNLGSVGAEVIDLSPGLQFMIDCPNHGLIRFDFEPFSRDGRQELAAQFRDAVWSLRHHVQGNTLYSLISSGVTPFWRFLDMLYAEAEREIVSLRDIDATLIRQYLAWIELQTAAKGKNRGKPWSLSWKKGAFDRLKTLLVNRQKLAPDLVSPDLAFPKNPYPRINLVTPPREPYTDGELRRIVEAINTDLRLLDKEGNAVLSSLQVVVVYLIALAVATGRNPQSLLDLRRDSVYPHPLSDREILITEKRRGYSTQVTSYRKADDESGRSDQVTTIPLNVGDYVRAAMEYTAPLAADASARNADFIFLHRIEWGPRGGEVHKLNIRKFNQAAESFVFRHGIKDDHGLPLRLYLARLRPTFGTRLYERTRDVRKVQQALGHSSPQVTARHYITLPESAHRDHTFVGQAMVGWVTSLDEKNAALLAADGKAPLADVRELLKGGYNTLVARCRNPFRENGSTCSKYLPCFTCPQMVVFEDDLWRLFSFYYKLLHERVRMNPNDWLQTYGPVIKIIDNEIAPDFPTEKVEAAKRRAQELPHPAWPRH